MKSLKTTFLGIDFSNPLVLASGYLGVTGSSLAQCIKMGAGAVTSKTIFMQERKGFANPSLLTFPGGLINAIGLSGEGIHHAKIEFESFKEKSSHSPLIASIGGETIKELEEIAEIINEYPVDIIELNFSCPNVDDEMGKPFACDPLMTANGVRAVRSKTKKPISVKLSPNTPIISEIAKKAEENGADAITAINTMGPGMLIDIDMRTPILANKVGGVSGQAIKPIALRCVYEIYKAVKIPIIGTGGIMNGNDAIAMMMAGANLIGIGSALSFYDMNAFEVIKKRMIEFMDKEGIKTAEELVGLAHE